MAPLLVSPSLRLAVQVNAEISSTLGTLESLRDDYRTAGDYTSAHHMQLQLQNKKQQEEENRVQALAEKHVQELADMNASHDDEQARFIRKWEYQLSELQHRVLKQEQQMMERHSEEQARFAKQWASSQMKIKWSSDLLNMRVQEEHLIRQREFAKAAKLKSKADELEAWEYQQLAAAWQAKMDLEETKMLQRQSKEAAALQARHQCQKDEFLLLQQRELDKLMKKCQSAKAALLRAHGQERIVLEQALKGWFNPKKFGLAPSPLLPSATPAGALSPGRRLPGDTWRRPETAPTRLQVSRSSIVPDPNSEGSSPYSKASGEECASVRRTDDDGKKVWDTSQTSSPTSTSRPSLAFERAASVGRALTSTGSFTRCEGGDSTQPCGSHSPRNLGHTPVLASRSKSLGTGLSSPAANVLTHKNLQAHARATSVLPGRFLSSRGSNALPSGSPYLSNIATSGSRGPTTSRPH